MSEKLKTIFQNAPKRLIRTISVIKLLTLAFSEGCTAVGTPLANETEENTSNPSSPPPLPSTNKPDQDGDGLSNEAESKARKERSIFKVKIDCRTNIWTQGEECRWGKFSSNSGITDPNNPDSDRDGVSDRNDLGRVCLQYTDYQVKAPWSFEGSSTKCIENLTTQRQFTRGFARELLSLEPPRTGAAIGD